MITMKRFCWLCAWFLAGALALAEGPDDQYVGIYTLIQEADKLAQLEQPAQALAKYQEAQNSLLRFQKGYPDWNAEVVKFRLNYVASRIGELSAKVPAKTQAENPTPGPQPAPAPAAPADQAAALAKSEREIQVLKEELRQSQSDRSLLEAKLKEALAARPAELDPAQLTKAQERIKALEKENDLLQTTLAQAKAKPLSAPDAKSQEQSRKKLEQSRLALAETNLKLVEQTEKVSLLEGRLKQLSTQSPGAATSSPPILTQDADQIKRLTNERDELRRKLDVALHSPGASSAPAATPGALLSDDLATELVKLRAKVTLYESRAQPYSAEELALLKTPGTKVASVPETNAASVTETKATAVPEAKPVPQPRYDPPQGGTALAAEAQRMFMLHQLDKAEGKYLELLHQDPDNVFTLANLAATQIELNKLDESLVHIQHALKLAPDHAFSLSILGQLRLRQKKYDEALEALNRAAQLDPQSAETQNYLGVTLSQKGMRVQAESALRKAVMLSPGYADAHNNLAVIYLSQTPPMTELARWHYQKALAAGSPARPEIEKMFEPKRAAASGP
jgi:tetratricopeptide (TPR) repeat protein